MPSQVTLIYRDDEGREARAAVHAPRFQIGRGADGDLVVADANLSRRHAVIEQIGDAVFVSDCGSQNGTTVNGEPVTGAVELRDGDILVLAGGRRFTVSIAGAGTFGSPGTSRHSPARSAYAPQSSAPVAPAPPSSARVAPAPQASAEARARPAWLNPVVIAPAAAVVLLLILGIALLAFKHWRGATGPANENDAVEGTLARGSSPRGGANGSKQPADASVASEARAARSIQSNDVRAGAGDGASDGTALPARATPSSDSDDLTRDIKRAMSRISSDNSPYISPQGIKDVTAKVRAYRGSLELRDKFRAMQRGCAETSALSQKENLNATLVMYAAIAEADARGASDAAAMVRQMLPKLSMLSATFGTASANSSLLLVAAYPYPFDPEIGSRQRKSHPLATKLMQQGGSRSTEETSVARTVWYLRERDALAPEAYELVVRLLAVGVIAENPARFGIDSAPLLC